MNTRRRTRSVVEQATFPLPLFPAVSTIFLFNRPAEASNPPSGTISPAGPNVSWQGPLTGGAGANETTCVEGSNCDTFKLTLSGTEADWEGKVVNVTVNWLNPANEIGRASCRERV